MDNQKETSGGWAPPTASSRERIFLRKLADHYYGLYLLGVIQGIVHNLNGPLQILYIRTEQLERSLQRLKDLAQSQQLAEVDKIASGIEGKIKSSMQSLDDLNAQLRHLTSDLIFERRCEIEDVNINQVIEECLFLLNANMFFKHTVNKTIRTQDPLPVLKGRKRDFCVIVLNLLQNALEAMAGAQKKHLTIETFSQGNQVIIRIQDTGCGILEEDCAHIYKACFTTKNRIENKDRADKHPGLGLSLVSLLLEDYNGFIECESVSGETTFTVQIPCVVNTSD
jgi:two-component system NtrC family sensor kinase